MTPKSVRWLSLYSYVYNKFIYFPQTEAHQDPVCRDGQCVLTWLEGRRFSHSARVALLAWVLLLARLVTSNHSPNGWTVSETNIYLSLLSHLQIMLIDAEKLDKRDLLVLLAAEFTRTFDGYNDRKEM